MNNQKSSVPQANNKVATNAQGHTVQQQVQSPRAVTSKKTSVKGGGGAGVEHQFLNKMPEVNSVENDLMKLLNEFSNTRLKKYGKIV